MSSSLLLLFPILGSLDPYPNHGYPDYGYPDHGCPAHGYPDYGCPDHGYQHSIDASFVGSQPVRARD